MFTAINALYFLCAILEPFIPSFSAKVYEQMAVTRIPRHETILQEVKNNFEAITTILPAGHTIGTPEPIFREIKEAEGVAWKKQFGGKDL